MNFLADRLQAEVILNKKTAQEAGFIRWVGSLFLTGPMGLDVYSKLNISTDKIVPQFVKHTLRARVHVTRGSVEGEGMIGTVMLLLIDLDVHRELNVLSSLLTCEMALWLWLSVLLVDAGALYCGSGVFGHVKTIGSLAFHGTFQ